MKLLSVYWAAGQLEADLLKAFLEAQGIEVLLSQESVGKTLGLSAGTLGRVEVLVPESQVERAKSLIFEMEQGKFDDLNFDSDKNNIIQPGSDP